MTTEPPFRLPDGPDVGIRGIQGALERLVVAMRGAESAVVVPIGEALFWIAALDNHFSGAVPDYVDRRHADTRGRTAAALLYARNLLGHGLHNSSAVVYTLANVEVRKTEEGPIHVSSRGPLISIAYVWAPLADLPQPGKPEKHSRDTWYQELVAGRPLSNPLETALYWYKELNPRVAS